MTTKTKHGTRWLCTTALLMAMNIIMSMSVFSVPVPGGHLYLNDVIICFAALILDPLGAFCVGGVGAFLGDFFFYPTPMFVSLVTHGLQAVAISLCAHRMMKEKPVIASLIGVLRGAVARRPGLGRVEVLAVAGHDTASAIAAVPAADERFAYLSSGTWSLMGIELPAPVITEESCAMNFTNEGGVDGTTRFLKNITGMWLLEECRRIWAKEGRTYT